MYVKEVVIQNQVGLHARPATFFIKNANEFKSSIWIEKEERRVNAKSLLGVLSLGIVGGNTIRIISDGIDEQEAVDSLVASVESGLAEFTGSNEIPMDSSPLSTENSDSSGVTGSNETPMEPSPLSTENGDSSGVTGSNETPMESSPLSTENGDSDRN